MHRGGDQLCRNPPKGPLTISTSVALRGIKDRPVIVSQSPEGSTDDFHGHMPWVGVVLSSGCRNPPKGPLTISTAGDLSLLFSSTYKRFLLTSRFDLSKSRGRSARFSSRSPQTAENTGDLPGSEKALTSRGFRAFRRLALFAIGIAPSVTESARSGRSVCAGTGPT